LKGNARSLARYALLMTKRDGSAGLAALVLLAALGALAAACGPSTNGTMCQSGPKYGTQCYVTTGAGDPIPTYASPSSPPSREPSPSR